MLATKTNKQDCQFLVLISFMIYNSAACVQESAHLVHSNIVNFLSFSASTFSLNAQGWLMGYNVLLIKLYSISAAVSESLFIFTQN